MVVHSDVQKRVQEEIDRVVGNDRLPDFSDHSSLPYLNALVKELLRWHPSIPVGVPHAAIADDEYNGYFIPGGTTVFANIWFAAVFFCRSNMTDLQHMAILRDPEVYAQPDDFIPDRFLDAAGNLDVRGRDPADVMFGFGRR